MYSWQVSPLPAPSLSNKEKTSVHHRRSRKKENHSRNSTTDKAHLEKKNPKGDAERKANHGKDWRKGSHHQTTRKVFVVQTWSPWMEIASGGSSLVYLCRKTSYIVWSLW